MAAPFNILHLMADQVTARALRLYGNRVCRTPHLDALAARGTVFTNAYCNFPLCAPSRVSMLAGRLASRVGVYDNACEFSAGEPTIPYYMGALGYRTALSGKMHFVGPDQLHGYQERLTTDIYPSDFGWTPDWQKAIPVAGTGVSLRSVVEAGTCVRSLQLDYDDEVGNRAVQWIYDYGRQKEAKPFFFTVSFSHPHNPYVIPQEYWDRYTEDEIDAPRVGPIPFDRLDPHSQRIWKIYKFGQYDITAEDVRRSRRAYYGMVSYIDDQVGRLLGALRDMQLEERTVVVFNSDHGDMLGERGLWYKWMHFEDAVRVPLIVSVPGQAPSRVEAPASLLDLMPTFLEVAGAQARGLEPVSPLEGESLLRSPSPDRPVFAEMNADGTTSPLLMVRKGDWKYIACEGDPPQLYDLREDPDELANLAGKPGHQAIERELRELIARHWNAEALKREMEYSARRRLFIQEARQQSGAPAWDYEPRKDASRQYVRGGSAGATAVKGLARFPFVPPKPPDHSID